MKYFKIDDLNVMIILAAETIAYDPIDTAEYNDVLLMVAGRESGSYFSGSEKFFVYSTDNVKDCKFEEISFKEFVKWMSILAEHVKDRHQTVRAFFEPNPDGNN